MLCQIAKASHLSKIVNSYQSNKPAVGYTQRSDNVMYMDELNSPLGESTCRKRGQNSGNDTSTNMTEVVRGNTY